MKENNIAPKSSTYNEETLGGEFKNSKRSVVSKQRLRRSIKRNARQVNLKLIFKEVGNANDPNRDPWLLPWEED